MVFNNFYMTHNLVLLIIFKLKKIKIPSHLGSKLLRDMQNH